MKTFYAILVLIFVGCATEYNLATQQEEMILYSNDREVSIGTKVAQSIEKNYEINTDVDVNQRVEKILKDIVAVSDRKDVVYFIKVINKDIINAISLPGGYIYIFQGLLDEIESDDELAAVVAHEVAHITAKHGIKRLQSSYGAMALQLLASHSNSEVASGVGLMLNTIFTEHSQEAEFESDRLGVKYLKAAGYDPHGMVKFLTRLRNKEERTSPKAIVYWRTHPHLSKRIAVVNQEIKGKLEFREYLNLMGD